MIREPPGFRLSRFNRSGAIRVALTSTQVCRSVKTPSFQSLGRDSGRSDSIRTPAVEPWLCCFNRSGAIRVALTDRGVARGGRGRSFNRSGAIRVALTLAVLVEGQADAVFQSLGRDSGRSDCRRKADNPHSTMFQSLGRDSGRSDSTKSNWYAIPSCFNRSGAIRVALTQNVRAQPHKLRGFNRSGAIRVALTQP